MDPATIIGFVVVLATTFLGLTMSGIDPFGAFLGDIGAIIIVLGGSVGASVMSSTLPDTINSFKAIVKAFTGGLPGEPAEVAQTMVDFADVARRDGLLALEESVKSVEDEFLAKGLQMAIDGTDPDQVRAIMEAELTALEDRHAASVAFPSAMVGYAPAFGVAGTVIGLIDMLGKLNDPSALGPAIAVAFITTLWGVFLANYIFGPIAARLKRLSALELAHKELILEGVMSIQAGSNPRAVADKLKSYLPPGAREDVGVQKKTA